jgi:hypothetical protein
MYPSGDTYTGKVLHGLCSAMNMQEKVERI